MKFETQNYNDQFAAELRGFDDFGRTTRVEYKDFTLWDGTTTSVPIYTNEFWTSKQRQANSLHEISYRACFKPQLPRFFIERLTQPGEGAYDPMMGRGTTLGEAALMGRDLALFCQSNEDFRPCGPAFFLKFILDCGKVQ